MRIEIRGYAGDCTIHGQIDLSGGRLSDALNHSDGLVVHDAVLNSLERGQSMSAGELPISLDDLFAIEAEGPSGEEQRRVRTVRTTLRVQSGPYIIYGDTHALPGIAALRAFHARRGLAPLTDCQVLFARAAQLEVVAAPFVLVNTRSIDSVEEATAEQMQDEIEARAAAIADLAQAADPTERAGAVA